MKIMRKGTNKLKQIRGNSKEKIKKIKERGITLIALIVTIVLNSSYLAMVQMNKFEKI